MSTAALRLLLAACLALHAVPARGANPEEDPAASAAPRRPPLGERARRASVHLKEDAVYLLTFPKRPTRRGVVGSAAVVAGIAALVFVDEDVREEVQEARSPTLDRWERRIENFGNITVTTPAAFATYGFGRLLDHEPTTETGRAMLEALLFTETITSASKGLFGREAPRQATGAGDFFSGGTIFPSGHTSRAFAIAAVLAERHGPVAAWIAYPVATLVGLSRMERDLHWSSDVLAGAALGEVIGRAVVRRRAGRARFPARVAFMAFPDPDSPGLCVRIRLGRRAAPASPAGDS